MLYPLSRTPPSGDIKEMPVKAHIRYKNKNGDIIPGVSTIANMLDKPALAPWANKLGLKGIDSNAYSREMGAIGTLAHSMIMAELKNEKLDISDYSQEQISKAENSFLSWLEWCKGKELSPILIEAPLISEQYQFGGTLDFLGLIDKTLILGDYKTGGIWREAYIQTCAYRQLAIENNYPPADKILILSIPRTEDEKFQEVSYTSFDNGFEAFLHLRRLYDILKDMK